MSSIVAEGPERLIYSPRDQRNDSHLSAFSGGRQPLNLLPESRQSNPHLRKDSVSGTAEGYPSYSGTTSPCDGRRSGSINPRR